MLVAAAVELNMVFLLLHILLVLVVQAAVEQEVLE